MIDLTKLSGDALINALRNPSSVVNQSNLKTMVTPGEATVMPLPGPELDLVGLEERLAALRPGGGAEANVGMAGSDSLDRVGYNEFRKTLRAPGDMGRYIADGERITFDEWKSYGSPANLDAAIAGGYKNPLTVGSLLSANTLSSGPEVPPLAGVTPDPSVFGGDYDPPSSGDVIDASTGLPVEAQPVFDPAPPRPPLSGGHLPGSPTDFVPTEPLLEVAPGGGGPMQTPPESLPVATPNYSNYSRPMNPGGLASLVQLPMFQEFAQQLHEAHPEQSALFSQMFMGGMQQPMMRPPMMGMGFGGGFSPYMNMMGMGRPMMPPPMMYGGMPMGMGYGGGYGGYGMGSPFMGGGYGYGMGLGSYYQPPMQQAPAPQPSTYSPAQPQQTNANYQPPQSPSPFGGALRGYYA